MPNTNRWRSKRSSSKVYLIMFLTILRVFWHGLIRISNQTFSKYPPFIVRIREFSNNWLYTFLFHYIQITYEAVYFQTVKSLILFRSLDNEQMTCVLNAMFERKVTTGDYIIQQVSIMKYNTHMLKLAHSHTHKQAHSHTHTRTLVAQLTRMTL